jgi:hypothetical protein
MVFNATCNNFSVISWRSDLLVEETGEPGENHRPAASHWQLYPIMLHTSPWSRFELTTSVVIGTDCIGSCKSKYHTITTTTAPRGIILFIIVYQFEDTDVFLSTFCKIYFNALIRNIHVLKMTIEYNISDQCKITLKQNKTKHILQENHIKCIIFSFVWLMIGS